MSKSLKDSRPWKIVKTNWIVFALLLVLFQFGVPLLTLTAVAAVMAIQGLQLNSDYSHSLNERNIALENQMEVINNSVHNRNQNTLENGLKK